jgi:hypothetical protein
VAEFLGGRAYTIWEYAKAGIIAARKVGKRWFFSKPDMVAWVREKVVYVKFCKLVRHTGFLVFRRR